MTFPTAVREDALVRCGRHCCLCHKFCGIKMELHHIVPKSEQGQDSIENCIPLCFDCHADMRSYDHSHPKGTKYTAEELRRHRDNWYSKVSSSPGPIYNDSSRKIDQAVFTQLVSLFPPSRIIFFEQHDFGAPFSPTLFGEMDNLVRVGDSPSSEFIDADLEGMRAKLIDDINDFANYLANNTWRTSSGMQSVPSEWEVHQYERLITVVQKLNADSTAIAQSYRTLYREARRRLGIDPVVAG